MRVKFYTDSFGYGRCSVKAKAGIWDFQLGEITAYHKMLATSYNFVIIYLTSQIKFEIEFENFEQANQFYDMIVERLHSHNQESEEQIGLKTYTQ